MNFRKHVLSTGRIVLAGKNATSNDELVNAASKKDIMLHTEASGSPFANAGEDPTKKEIEEAAIFCARYSQDWRDNKTDVLVKIFSRSSMHKDHTMDAGTWAVKDKETIKVKKSDILKFEKLEGN